MSFFACVHCNRTLEDDKHRLEMSLSLAHERIAALERAKDKMGARAQHHAGPAETVARCGNASSCLNTSQPSPPEIQAVLPVFPDLVLFRLLVKHVLAPC